MRKLFEYVNRTTAIGSLKICECEAPRLVLPVRVLSMAMALVSFRRVSEGPRFRRVGEGPMFRRVGEGPMFRRVGEGLRFRRLGVWVECLSLRFRQAG